MNKRIRFWLLTLLAALLLVSCEREETPIDPSLTDPEIQSGEPAPVTTAAPETSSALETTTAAPPEMTAPPSGKVLTAEGELKATPVKNLDLRAHCRVTYVEGADTAEVTVALYLDHYSMTVGERAGCYVSVNGEKVKFTAPGISLSEESRVSTLLTEQTFQLKKQAGESAFTMDLEAAYIFNGVYANTKITDITIKESVRLGQ
ncbi:MAG: hypothetical protein E7655_03250 [Ruminococcaceae bacterium]|nr:hypothetical protein [Oscillospiraceae bacterium]